jgi:hypothetical protein
VFYIWLLFGKRKNYSRTVFYIWLLAGRRKKDCHRRGRRERGGKPAEESKGVEHREAEAWAQADLAAENRTLRTIDEIKEKRPVMSRASFLVSISSMTNRIGKLCTFPQVYFWIVFSGMDAICDLEGA